MSSQGSGPGTRPGAGEDLGWRRVGAHALLVELDDDRDVASTYAHISRLVADGRLAVPRDVVPAARTVLVDGVEPDAWWSAFRAAGAVPKAERLDVEARSVSLRVRYDGVDLDDVARQWDCGVDEVVDRHAGAEFRVAFCGFAPGFAYCTSDPALPEVARRDDPRQAVPAGAVGLAGPYSGVYPTRMPGGWQLIGTTPEVMFDPSRDEPALLRPGDHVRFEATG